MRNSMSEAMAVAKSRLRLSCAAVFATAPCMLLLNALPAQAGSWQFSITGSSSNAGAGQPVTAYTPPQGQASFTGWSGSVGFNGQVTPTLTLQVTATWVPNPSLPSDPAPPQAFIETAGASGTVYAPAGSSSTVADGVGDTANNAPSNGANAYATTTGKHLIQATNGTFTITRTLTASLTGNVGTYTMPFVGANWSFSYSIALDSRRASITSSIDPTYHRGVNAAGHPIPVMDLPGSDGTVQANSAAWDVTTISYMLHASGAWAAGSNYLEHCSSQDPQGGSNSAYTMTGQFTLPVDPLCLLTVPYGASSTGEHAYGHLTDYKDGASATANYYVTFHPAVENWNRLTMTYNPLPTGGPVNPTTTGQWQVYGAFPNTTSVNQSQSCSVTSQTTDSVSGTFTLDQSFGRTLNIDDLSKNAAFAAHEGVTIGQQTSTGTTQTSTITLVPGKLTYIFWGWGSTDRSGTCDLYDMNGYEGQTNYNCHAPNMDPGGNPIPIFTELTEPLPTN